MWLWKVPDYTDHFRLIYSKLNRLEARIMANFDDASAKADELIAASAAERAQLQDANARLVDIGNQLAEALKNAAPDMQPLVDKMQAEIDALKADDPVVAPEPAPETPPAE